MNLIYQMTVCSFGICSISGCNPMHREQTALIEKARSIKFYPVPRTSFVELLALENIKSERIEGGLRAGTCTSVEIWRGKEGLNIHAYDFEQHGTILIQGVKDSDFRHQVSHVTIDGLPPLAPQPPAHNSFQQVILSTPSGKEVFRSVPD